MTCSVDLVVTGVFLPKLCEAQGANARRQMSEIRSSGFVAPGPVKSANLVAEAPVNYMNLKAEYYVAPAQAPAY